MNKIKNEEMTIKSGVEFAKIWGGERGDKHRIECTIHLAYNGNGKNRCSAHESKRIDGNDPWYEPNEANGDERTKKNEKYLYIHTKTNTLNTKHTHPKS